MARTSNPHPSIIPPGGGPPAAGGLRGWLVRHPVLAHFVAAYALTAVAAVMVYGPTLLGHVTPSGRRSGVLAAFPTIVIGVGGAAIALTSATPAAAGAVSCGPAPLLLHCDPTPRPTPPPAAAPADRRRRGSRPVGSASGG